MKTKIAIASFLALLVGTALYAAQPKFIVPISENNIADVGGTWSGVETVSLVTSTNAALVTDSNSNTITDGFIQWVILGSTDDVTTGGGLYLEVRSSDTANVTSARLIPRIRTTENSSGVVSTSQFLQFKPPVPFSNDGLSVNIGPAGTDPGAVEFAIGVGWKRQ